MIDDGPAAAGGELGPGDQIRLTSGAHVFRGGMWKIVSTVLPQIYSLVLSVVAARFLGPNGLGRQSFLAFVELSTISLLTSGMARALMRFVGVTVGRGRAAEVRTLTVWAWRLEIAAATVGGTAFGVAALAGADPASAWVLAGVACAAGVMQAVPAAVLIGLQQWRNASMAGLITGGAGTAATIAVLAAGGGITGMFAVEAVASIAGLAWTTRRARRALNGFAPVAEPTNLLKPLLRFALLASVNVIVELIVWSRSEFFVLNHYAPHAQIAFYSIAFAIALAVVRLPGTIGDTLSPAVANLVGTGEFDRIRSGFSRAVRLLMLLTLPLVAVSAALGPTLIAFVWGKEYEEAGEVFRILAIASCVTPLQMLSTSLLGGLGRLRPIFVADGCAAVVDLGLAFALIPHHGAVGAAIANSGAQLAAAIPTVLYASRRLGRVRYDVPVLARAAVVSGAAGAAALGVTLVLDGLPGLLLGTVAAVGTFVALGSLVGVLARDDAVWLADVLGRRAGPLPRRLTMILSGRSTRHAAS